RGGTARRLEERREPPRAERGGAPRGRGAEPVAGYSGERLRGCRSRDREELRELVDRPYPRGIDHFRGSERRRQLGGRRRPARGPGGGGVGPGGTTQGAGLPRARRAGASA